MIESNPLYQLEFTKRIADPVHGLIKLTKLEAKILETPIFQRLRGITQLGMAKYVYPGAMHNRFSHSLGVLQNATDMYDAAYRNWKKNKYQGRAGTDIDEDWLFDPSLLQSTRLAALCHDLGHFPFSHDLEEAFDWLAKEKIIKASFRHEKLSEVIINDLLGDILGDHASLISDMITGRMNDKILFPSSIISGAIDADRMDYLVRDALNCGVKHGEFDKERLMDTVMPYNTKVDGSDVDILAFSAKGIEAIEQFLLARHRMHQTIYFNPSVIGFEGSIRRAYYRISSDNPPWELPDVFLEEPEKFVDFDEYSFFSDLRREIKKKDSWLSSSLVNRKPLVKMGPYYHTTIQGSKSGDRENEIYGILREIQEKVEVPHTDWNGKDHWGFAEHKTQSLVKSIPRSIMRSTDDGFEDITDLKNVILLVNADGNLIDPTNIIGGGQHTFLPFIANYHYHRFIFYTNKKNTDKMNKVLQPLQSEFADLQSRKPSIDQ